MRIVVDEQLCKGHGVCMGEAEEVFQVARDGTMTILQPSPPESLRNKVKAATTYCPTGALSLHDD